MPRTDARPYARRVARLRDQARWRREVAGLTARQVLERMLAAVAAVAGAHAELDYFRAHDHTKALASHQLAELAMVEAIALHHELRARKGGITT